MAEGFGKNLGNLSDPGSIPGSCIWNWVLSTSAWVWNWIFFIVFSCFYCIRTKLVQCKSLHAMQKLAHHASWLTTSHHVYLIACLHTDTRPPLDLLTNHWWNYPGYWWACHVSHQERFCWGRNVRPLTICLAFLPQVILDCKQFAFKI